MPRTRCSTTTEYGHDKPNAKLRNYISPVKMQDVNTCLSINSWQYSYLTPLPPFPMAYTLTLLLKVSISCCSDATRSVMPLSANT